MKNNLKDILFRISRVFLILSLLVFLIQPFVPNSKIKLLLFWTCVVFFIAVQPLVNRSYRLPVYLLTFFAILIFLVFKEPTSVLIDGVPDMLNLVALLTAMQAFSVPISVGKYSQSMGTVLLSGIHRERTLFGISEIIMTLFSCFTSMGAIVVVLNLLEDSIKNSVKDFRRFATCSISRGYLGAILWSPAGITVLMVSSITGVKWAEFFPYCLLLSVLGLFLSVMIQYAGGKRTLLLDTSSYPPITKADLKKARTKLCHVIAVTVSMILGVNICESTLSVSSTHSIIITGCVIFAVWMLFLAKSNTEKGSVKTATRQYWQVGIPRSFDLGALFIAMGVFTKALSESPLVDMIAEKIVFITSNEMIIAALFPVVTVLLGLVGVHPFISVSLAGSILLMCNPNMSMLPIAISLIFGASVTYIVSPLAGVTLALSKVLDCPTKDIIKQNMAYAGGFYVIAMIIIMMVELL